MEPLLRVNKLSKRFGGVQAVDDISFAADSGQIVALIGPNGAGKTTVVNMISGVTQADAGTVHIADADLFGLDVASRAHAGLVRTFQHPRIFSDLTLLENVAVGLDQRQQRTIRQDLIGRGGRYDRKLWEACADALRRVGLDVDPSQLAGRLTTGQEKLLELARLLVVEPSVMLLDEPAAGLDDQETAQLADRLAEMRSAGLCMVLVEHDMNMVMSISDHVVVIDSGSKIAEGGPREIRSDPKVIEAYLGMDDAS